MNTNVLVVEDNPVTRKMVRFALEQAGFGVIEAADGTTALRVFTDQPIALVLQDLVLPDLDGFELVRRLRLLPRGDIVPILAFSGLMSKLEEARISTVGFDDVISKPIEPSRLLQIVRTHLTLDPTAEDLFGTGRRLLVVDDDPVQRKLVAFRLKKVGFEVTVASDGMEAFERAKNGRPHIVVADVLMPRLDGFGLCMKIRRDDAIASTPVVLVTNSYVERADRELAQRAGANTLILRTPDLRELMEAVRACLDKPPPPSELTASDPEIDVERVQRMMRQLERQVGINAGVTQRCALLSAELAVVNGISAALASRDGIDSALGDALAACFDAGGVSLGVLYLVEGDDIRVVNFGLSSEWTELELLDFFGERALLERAIYAQELVVISAQERTADEHRHLLERTRASSALIAPLVYQGRPLGALLMMSRTLEMNTPDRILFGQTVAGQMAQALAVTRAFAEKQASERIAKEQAAVLRSILESIADGVVVVDAEGKFIHWNPAAEVILNKKRLDLLQHWSQELGLFESDQVTPLPIDRQPLVRATHGESVERQELFLRHKGLPDGRWLSLTAQPWRDENGRIRGGVAAFHDVTEQKAAQSQLMASDRMASVGLLAASVAHDINNPLAAVVTNLDIAQQELRDHGESGGEIPGEVQEMIEDARTAADQVRRIVRDLKTFSRHEEEQSRSVDVQQVVESSLRMAWHEIRYRSQLVRDYSPVGPVQGVESRLGQVFLNLIVNAAQAIPEGDVASNVIRVVTRMHGADWVAVDICDSGCGIPPERMKSLFNPFFTTKAPGVGTGLGLAICQRIVMEHGGRIEVDSQAGHGTTFTVLLPASQVLVTVQKQPSNVEAVHRRGRLLVVDDEPLIGVAIRRAFLREHEVVTTTSARKALDLIATGKTFDVILCDLVMPQMTGMEFHEHLAPELAERIIFLTGGAFTPAARRFFEQSHGRCVEKPFDVNELRALVNGLIER